MKVTRSHKIALDPTPEQETAFRKAAGVARFAWNWALAEWNRLYKAGEKPDGPSLKKRFNAVKADLFPWIYESPRDANAQPFAHLDRAFRDFFRDRKKSGKKNSRKRGYPRFKKKGRCRDSFYVANDRFHVEGKTIRLPKVGTVRMREALRFEGKVLCATVSRTASRWFVSISVEVDLPVIPCENQAGTIGVDLGIRKLATFSDGTTIDGPKPLRRALRRFRRLSRSLSRKAKGSRNRDKARQRLSRCHARIANIRSDCLHKLTSHLVGRHGCIVIEDLNVKGMARNRKLARAIHDMGFGEFRRQLGYKAEVSPCEVIVADRWFPSSRLCRICHAKNDGLTLKDRIFRCDACGHAEDRDLNASRNPGTIPAARGKSIRLRTPGRWPAGKTGRRNSDG